MNTELLEALNILEKEKSISKDTLLEAIEQSLLQACKNHFGRQTTSRSILTMRPVISVCLLKKP